MKQALILSIMVLTIAILIRLPDSSPAASDGDNGATTFTDIAIMSTGKTFRRAVLGRRRFVAGMLFDERIIEHNHQKDALMVTVLDPEHEMESTHSFDLKHSANDIASFLELIREFKNGHVLCLSVSRSIQIQKTAEIAPFLPSISDHFTEIGAGQRPWEETACSWILISIKVNDRWIPLAEHFSTYTGITLHFSLSRDHEQYTEHTPERLSFTRPRGPQIVHLLDHLEHTSILSEQAVFMPAAQLVEPNRDSILIPPESTPTKGAETRIQWDELLLGKNTLLKVGAAAVTDPGTPAIPVSYRILANDKELFKQTISSRSLPILDWTDLEIDLSAYDGQTIQLTMTADSPSSLPGVYWGEPMLQMHFQ